jgi:hypothetical protein
MRQAHRVAWELLNGPLRPGEVVLHTCDNAQCVNPNHLRKGTQHDNVRDMFRKGRNVVLPGSKNGSALLDEDKVRYAREQYARGRTLKDIGDELGVHLSTIHLAVTRKKWKHVA